MARTLRSYRMYLAEKCQLRVLEIGQRVQPSQTEFEFGETVSGYDSKFSDGSGNNIKVMFHLVEKKWRGYEVEFSVNGTSFGTDQRVPLRQFFVIISTVIECINKFIIKIDPLKLYIDAADKTGRFGQKYKIWREYILQNIHDTGFAVCPDEKDVIVLQKNVGNLKG